VEVSSLEKRAEQKHTTYRIRVNCRKLPKTWRLWFSCRSVCNCILVC